MANLAEKQVHTKGKYEPLATLLGISFEDGTKYGLQVKGYCKLCEANSVPTEGGYDVGPHIPQIIYTCGDSTLYIHTSHPVMINVSQEES